jgi:hypothetical protein
MVIAVASPQAISHQCIKDLGARDDFPWNTITTKVDRYTEQAVTLDITVQRERNRWANQN